MSRIHPRHLARAAVALGAGALLAVAVPLAASAHVTVTPAEAEPGSFTTLVVNAPDESDTASTVKLVVDLPTDHPLLTVRWVPVPGWTAVAETRKLPKPIVSGDDTITEAVTRITWTATDGGAPPGSTEQFPLSVGPIPDATLLRFPAHQYYSDGTVVDWTGASESSAHPAPRVVIAAATAPAASASDPDLVARILGFGGLVLGAAGVVVAVLALRRRPSAS